MSDPLFSSAEPRQEGGRGGRSRPRCLPHCCRQPRSLRHGRHKAPPAAPRRSRSLAKTSTNRSEVSHVHAAARFDGEPRVQKGEHSSRVCVPPVFSSVEVQQAATRGGDEGLRRRVGMRLRGTLRALERQHPYARPAFVNRQERASLDVLTMRFECPGDDARGAIGEQVLSAELDDARPMRRRRPRGLPRSRGRS